uniref:cation:proton antiporter n=1 Tax=[Clostridium] polysaccharolyticum TaxID=29364 RepID=UPI000B83F47C
MMEYNYLISLAIILLSTKVLGLATKRVKLPQVVGALLAGLLLGPAFFGVITSTDFLSEVSEIGVIVLMFVAGLETDIVELKKTGKASFVIALLGVLIPLGGGYFLASIFNEGDASLGTSIFLQNMFIGIIMTATSVSITVETLKELGKLSTKAGNAILGAALIDDILGIVALTIITSAASSSVNIGIVLLKIVAFFIVGSAASAAFHFGFKKWVASADTDLRRFVVISFAFCLLMSYCAEEFFGVADITGAFIAGVAISGNLRIHYITSRFETLSYMLLSPVFFASIGLKVELPKMTEKIIIFAVLLVIVALLTKVIGCGLGAKVCGFTNEESIQIGTGMISRGEVALIVANKGIATGLMSSALFGPVVIMVIVTTIVTPILLKLVFKDKAVEVSSEPSDLLKSYSESSKIDEMEQKGL